MAAHIITELPDRSETVLDSLSRGGLSVVRLEWLNPGQYFVAPQDRIRGYLAFSLRSTDSAVVLVPGEGEDGEGYTILPTNPPLEFGGGVTRCLTQSVWRINAAFAGGITVIACR